MFCTERERDSRMYIYFNEVTHFPQSVKNARLWEKGHSSGITNLATEGFAMPVNVLITSTSFVPSDADLFQASGFYGDSKYVFLELPLA